MSGKKSIGIKDLLDLGLLNSEKPLTWKRRSEGLTFTAIVKSNGFIQTADGVIHKSPSGAARHLNGGKPIDGWLAWRVEETGETLAEMRERSVCK
jgi:hypothetical protein